MRDHRPRRHRLVATLALAAMAVGLAAPAALAQEDPTQESPSPSWEGSTLTTPADGSSMSKETFTVEGVFDVDSGIDIQFITVDFGRSAEDGFDPADEDECVPDDPSPWSRSGDSEGGVEVTSSERDDLDDDPEEDDPEGNRVEFEVAGVSWPCNGRFMIQATADATDRHTITSTFRVAVPPPPVPSMTATAAGEADEEHGPSEDAPETITITWEKLDPWKESAGYRVERTSTGAEGWTTVATVETEADETEADETEADEAKVTDTVSDPAIYTYRVRALRGSGIEGTGPVPSPADTSPSAELDLRGTAATSTTTTTEPSSTSPSTTSGAVTVTGSTPTSTTTDGDGGATGSRSNRGGTFSVPSPPTTIDTGFEETLDYGEQSSSGDQELAEGGEGQSVIRTEDDSVGLLGPVAGALVLLGWAGHVAYLNRLAKQF